MFNGLHGLMYGPSRKGKNSLSHSHTHTASSATADCYAYFITKTDIFTLATAAFL